MRPVQSILCPIDIDRPSHAALRYAFFLAEAFYASLEVAHARVPAPGVVEGSDSQRGSSGRAEYSMNERVTRGRLEGLLRSVTTAVPGRASAHIVEGGPLSGILRSALRFRSDLIVVGSHDEARPDGLFGASLAEQIAYAAACPVLSIHEGGHPLALRVRHILMPVDFRSETLAVKWATLFARCFGATVELLNVGARSGMDGEHHHLAASDGQRAKLDELRDRLRTSGVGVDDARSLDGTAIDRILERTESGGCDLVVMGEEPRGKKVSESEPSLSADVRRHASIPVLSLRHAGAPSAVTSRGFGSEVSAFPGPSPRVFARSISA